MVFFFCLYFTRFLLFVKKNSFKQGMKGPVFEITHLGSTFIFRCIFLANFYDGVYFEKIFTIRVNSW